MGKKLKIGLCIIGVVAAVLLAGMVVLLLITHTKEGVVIDGASGGRTLDFGKHDSVDVDALNKKLKSKEFINALKQSLSRHEDLVKTWTHRNVKFNAWVELDGKLLVDYTVPVYSTRYTTFDLSNGLTTHHGGTDRPDMTREMERGNNQIENAIRQAVENTVAELSSQGK